MCPRGRAIVEYAKKRLSWPWEGVERPTCSSPSIPLDPRPDRAAHTGFAGTVGGWGRRLPPASPWAGPRAGPIHPPASSLLLAYGGPSRSRPGQARDAERFTLVGRGLSIRATGGALAAAFVTGCPGRVTLTGEDGVFPLGPVPEGPLVVGVERFGYEGASFDAQRPVQGFPPILELSPLPWWWTCDGDGGPWPGPKGRLSPGCARSPSGS